MKDPCNHSANNAVDAELNYAEEIGRYSITFRVHCVDCGKVFQFLGAPMGFDLTGVAVSPDGLELRCGIVPQGEVPPPIAGARGFSIRKVE